MSELAAIFGVLGPKLTAGERAFFRDANPWGFILFARNIETPEQIRRLTSDLRACVGRDCLIFIDQEGGRVQRLRPPHWRNYASYATLATNYNDEPEEARRLVWLHHRLIADDLRALGINANCAPCIDVKRLGAHDIISDRAFSRHAEKVADMGHAAMAGLMAGGVAPVVKHIPGHGRAKVDSHHALPHIETKLSTLRKTDFLPFKMLNQAPMGMTAHAVYKALDKRLPITLSKLSLPIIIRDEIGFDGLVMTDDLDMHALSGSLTSRAERALAAGCDVVLHCNGKMASMVKVAKGTQKLSKESQKRADIAVLCTEHIEEYDRKAAESNYDTQVSKFDVS